MNLFLNNVLLNIGLNPSKSEMTRPYNSAENGNSTMFLTILIILLIIGLYIGIKVWLSIKKDKK
ncbi:MAG: hypothetical protein WCK02_13575 [Bacteroidota bacterium]